MPIHAVKYFNDASEKNNTLSMANLAYRYLYKGFIQEAEMQLNKARQNANVHPNVSAATAEISELQEKENQKRKDSIQIGVRQRTFLLEYANARFISNTIPASFSGNWSYGQENINIDDNDGKISATWGKSPGRRKLKGMINGRTAIVNIQNQIAWMTLQETYASGIDALCYLSSDATTLHIMILDKEKPEYLDFVVSKS